MLAFGLVPAWRASGANPGQVMNMQGSRSVGGRGSARFRTTLTTAQIAFSMVLLVLAGLFARSLMNISREDLGIDVDSLVTFGITAQLSCDLRELRARLSGTGVPQGLAKVADKVTEVLEEHMIVQEVVSCWRAATWRAA